MCMHDRIDASKALSLMYLDMVLPNPRNAE
jgi:hypothetical protein